MDRILSAGAEAPPSIPCSKIDCGQPPPLDVWFVHVGHGDCTIIRHPDGRFTVVDTHLRKSAATQVVDVVSDALGVRNVLDAFRELSSPAARTTEERLRDDPPSLLKQLGAAEVFRLVLTHPDMDHLRGLVRLAAHFRIRNIWDTYNLKWGDGGFLTAEDRVEWFAYQGCRAGASDSTVLRLCAGHTGARWTADGIDVLSPSPGDIVESHRVRNWNRLSYVLRVRHGQSALILPGDADTDVLDRLAGEHGTGLGCSVLKASHHGRRTGYSASFLRAANPKITIVTSGDVKREHDATPLYRKKSHVLSTRRAGTIHVRLHFDGKVERSTAQDRRDPRLGVGAITDFMRLMGRR